MEAHAGAIDDGSMSHTARKIGDQSQLLRGQKIFVQKICEKNYNIQLKIAGNIIINSCTFFEMASEFHKTLLTTDKPVFAIAPRNKIVNYR